MFKKYWVISLLVLQSLFGKDITGEDSLKIKDLVNSLIDYELIQIKDPDFYQVFKGPVYNVNRHFKFNEGRNDPTIATVINNKVYEFNYLNDKDFSYFISEHVRIKSPSDIELIQNVLYRIYNFPHERFLAIKKINDSWYIYSKNGFMPSETDAFILKVDSIGKIVEANFIMGVSGYER